MSEPISFVCALAGQNTAARCLTISSDGSAKLVLELDASQLTSVLPILGLAGKVFRVSVAAGE